MPAGAQTLANFLQWAPPPWPGLRLNTGPGELAPCVGGGGGQPPTGRASVSHRAAPTEGSEPLTAQCPRHRPARVSLPSSEAPGCRGHRVGWSPAGAPLGSPPSLSFLGGLRRDLTQEALVPHSWAEWGAPWAPSSAHSTLSPWVSLGLCTQPGRVLTAASLPVCLCLHTEAEGQQLPRTPA